MPVNLFLLGFTLLVGQAPAVSTLPASDSHIVYSPYNWARASEASVQSPNPGAYLKVGFTGTQIGINLDVSPLRAASVPRDQYPVVRFSIDGGPATTTQLQPESQSIACGKGLSDGVHQLLFQYVAGYVFLDFWTPINVLRVAGFTIDEGMTLVAPSSSGRKQSRNALFLGDSITNGDDDEATFADGITNNVGTQDATVGYPAVVASGLGAEYGIVAYGGASWDNRAADGRTPGLMTSFSMVDSTHPRLVKGKLLPTPDDIFVNMGENSPPTGDDVPKFLAGLRAAGGRDTNIFLIIPFSGRARAELKSGLDVYRKTAPRDGHTFLMDLDNNPYLRAGRSTMQSVDGQHPLASLHALLAAQIVDARARLLSKGAARSRPQLGN